MHQPHQSEPVKSSMTSLFSFLAWACAFGRSVNHCNSSAPACSSAQHAMSPILIFFIISYYFVEFRLRQESFCSFPAVFRPQPASFLRICERFARAEPIVKPGALPLGGRNHNALELTGAANETYASAAQRRRSGH